MIAHLTSVNPFFQDAHEVCRKDRGLPGKAHTDHVQRGLGAEHQSPWFFVPVNCLRKGEAPASPPIHARLDLDQIVVVKRPSVGAGGFHNRQVQLLIHETAIRISEVSKKSLSTQFQEMKIIAVVDRLSQVHLEEGNTERSPVPDSGRFVFALAASHYRNLHEGERKGRPAITACNRFAAAGFSAI